MGFRRQHALLLILITFAPCAVQRGWCQPDGALYPGDAPPPAAACVPLLSGRTFCLNATGATPLVLVAYRRQDAFSRYMWRVASVQVGPGAGKKQRRCIHIDRISTALAPRAASSCCLRPYRPTTNTASHAPLANNPPNSARGGAHLQLLIESAPPEVQFLVASWDPDPAAARLDTESLSAAADAAAARSGLPPARLAQLRARLRFAAVPVAALPAWVAATLSLWSTEVKLLRATSPTPAPTPAAAAAADTEGDATPAAALLPLGGGLSSPLGRAARDNGPGGVGPLEAAAGGSAPLKSPLEARPLSLLGEPFQAEVGRLDSYYQWLPPPPAPGARVRLAAVGVRAAAGALNGSWVLVQAPRGCGGGDGPGDGSGGGEGQDDGGSGSGRLSWVAQRLLKAVGDGGGGSGGNGRSLEDLITGERTGGDGGSGCKCSYAEVISRLQVSGWCQAGAASVPAIKMLTCSRPPFYQIRACQSQMHSSRRIVLHNTPSQMTESRRRAPRACCSTPTPARPTSTSSAPFGPRTRTPRRRSRRRRCRGRRGSP
jgi:hypothetical protein